MENNTAFIGKIGFIEPIEKADRIVSAKVMLNGIPITQVVVGKGEFQEGDLIVYFDSNLCLSDVAIEKLNKQNPRFGEENFEGIERYLAKGNRVRTIKLKSVISDGLVVKPVLFHTFFKSEKEASKTLVEGFNFSSIGDTEICHKYIVPVRTQSQSSGKKKRKNSSQGPVIVPGHFPEHDDTEQLLRNLHKVNPDDIIHLSRKYHGTSSRAGNVLIQRKLSFTEKVLKKLGVKISDTEYRYAYGSRRVTKKIEDIEDKGDKTHYYNVDIWAEAGEKFFKGKLAKGEMVFFEIVGWLPNGSPIQKVFNNVYNYGAAENTYKIFVYRFTQTTEDGRVIEYSSQQVRNRCRELNVECVEQYYFGYARDLFPDIEVNDNWHKNFAERMVLTYLEKDCWDCVNPDTADEGVVLSIDNGGDCQKFKLKSKRFLERESEAANKGLVVDAEDGTEEVPM